MTNYIQRSCSVSIPCENQFSKPCSNCRPSDLVLQLGCRSRCILLADRRLRTWDRSCPPGLLIRARRCAIRVDWKQCEGQVVNDKFPLQRFLGCTDHSAVFLTQSSDQQSKNLAIKFLTAGAAADSQTSLWRRASNLNHPNLLRLLRGGRCRLADVDLIFVVMEHAEENLGHVLLERPLSAKEARELLGPLLDALKHIQSKGFAHSHIKPSNILAIGDHLKLACDTVFPLGEMRPNYRLADAYDAPEIANSLLAAPCDIWSLGMTIVEILQQRIPELSPQGQADPIVPSTILQPFFDIAQHCLRRDPLLRWTTAQIAECLSPTPAPVTLPGASSDAAKAAPPAVATPEVTADIGKTASTPSAAPPVVAAAGKPAPALVAVPEVTADIGKTASTPSATPAVVAAVGKPASAPVPEVTAGIGKTASTPSVVPTVAAAASVASTGKTVEPSAEMWEDITYTWVVLCKNYFFHMRQNLFFRHRIPLAYTDPFAPVPAVDGPFEVKCDDCGKTYVYRRSGLRRYQGEVPKFKTHPLF